jgi:predicted lipoprotein with Yx(FWY)xxD motif
MTEKGEDASKQSTSAKKLPPIPLKQAGNAEGTSDIIRKADTKRKNE